MTGDGLTFQVVGCNHRSTPLEVREQLALTPEKLECLRAALATDNGLRESYILHTCNRLEIYGVGTHPAAERLFYHLQTATGFEAKALQEHAYSLDAEQAVNHLFEVASGLDSQLLGETEILKVDPHPHRDRPRTGKPRKRGGGIG